MRRLCLEVNCFQVLGHFGLLLDKRKVRESAVPFPVAWFTFQFFAFEVLPPSSASKPPKTLFVLTLRSLLSLRSYLWKPFVHPSSKPLSSVRVLWRPTSLKLEVAAVFWTRNRARKQRTLPRNRATVAGMRRRRRKANVCFSLSPAGLNTRSGWNLQ